MMTRKLLSKIKLLDDPDEKIFELIKESFINDGIEVIPYLEEIWLKSKNPLVQKRIENIINSIQQANLIKEFTEWKNNGTKDLLYGAYLVAKYAYNEINWKNIEKVINKIKKDIWIELNENLTALEKVRLLNYVLFDIHGYSVNSEEPNLIPNFYINNVIDNKKGNAISLAILYIGVAQRLNLPIFGVDVPKNFLACYIDAISAFEAFGDNINTPVLFYINPVNKGIVFGRREISQYLKKIKIKPIEEFYKPTTNIKIIERLISNLTVLYEQNGQHKKVDDLNNLLEILLK